MKKKLTTKEKIIQTAVSMYNELGIQNVTTRHIAFEMGISHGNLNYHYNKREDLMVAIYERMRNEMSEFYFLKEENNSAFEQFHKLVLHLDKFQLKYRFFNLDVLEISRSYPRVRELLQETLELRKNQMTVYFNKFTQEGLIEENPEIGYERLKHSIRILITFWLPQQEVLPSYKSHQLGVMPQYIWDLILPYMTPKGWTEYNKVLRKTSGQPNLSH